MQLPSRSPSVPRTQLPSEKKHRPASMSALSSLSTPSKSPGPSPRSDSFPNNTTSLFAPDGLKTLVIKGTSSIMEVHASPTRGRLFGSFSGVAGLSGDNEGSSKEELDISVDHYEAGCRGEIVSKGWMVPVPEGVEQNWEGHWNLADVQEVQMMLRMLR